jgi:hypothetical protein
VGAGGSQKTEDGANRGSIYYASFAIYRFSASRGRMRAPGLLKMNYKQPGKLQRLRMRENSQLSLSGWKIADTVTTGYLLFNNTIYLKILKKGLTGWTFTLAVPHYLMKKQRIKEQKMKNFLIP